MIHNVKYYHLALNLSSRSQNTTLANREGRLAQLKETRAQLERQAREKAALQEAKIEAPRQEEEVIGEKKRGRKLKKPDKNPDPKKAKANLTNLDSQIMKTRNGHLQGYNAQTMWNCTM